MGLREIMKLRRSQPIVFFATGDEFGPSILTLKARNFQDDIFGNRKQYFKDDYRTLVAHCKILLETFIGQNCWETTGTSANFYFFSRSPFPACFNAKTKLSGWFELVAVVGKFL